ncbi:MAG: lytic transglycosylase domain-containing protein [Syntrophorhabdaceae bacterium]|nr:lytic transglycosylase domain-containing protein [Syntrophorhabdaceae bacterium]
MSKRFSSNLLTDEETDKLFCVVSKKYRLKKLLLKASATCESSLDERAYRYEPEFFRRYLADKPEWKDQDPAIVSASYGLFQIMWTTAWYLGFRGTQEDLWNPVINANLGAKLLRQLLDEVAKEGVCNTYFELSPITVALCRYNGGNRNNPAPDGTLRNKKYSDRVMRTFEELKKKEIECSDL